MGRLALPRRGQRYYNSPKYSFGCQVPACLNFCLNYLLERQLERLQTKANLVYTLQFSNEVSRRTPHRRVRSALLRRKEDWRLSSDNSEEIGHTELATSQYFFYV